MLKKDEEKAHNITARTVQKLLGPPPFRHSQIEEKDQVGLVTGLAWTQVGGELLAVESLIMPGKGKNLVTGKLGDVMKESAQAALSLVRTGSSYLGLDDKFYDNIDVHIHVPAGSVPKDGPSAGITMITSIASAFTQRKVKRNIAMTGEITLRGKLMSFKEITRGGQISLQKLSRTGMLAGDTVLVDVQDGEFTFDVVEPVTSI